MRFRCKACGQEAPTSQATMRANSEGKPIPVCPRCIKKSDSARRSLDQFKEKRRVLDIMGSCFEDLEIYEDGKGKEHALAFLKKNLPMFPQIADAWRTGGLSAAISARSKINAEYSEQTRILRDRLLSNVGHCTDAKEYKEPLESILLERADALGQRFEVKNEKNPMKRSARRREKERCLAIGRRREKERERKRNIKGAERSKTIRGNARGNEDHDAICEAVYDFLTGDEKD